MSEDTETKAPEQFVIFAIPNLTHYMTKETFGAALSTEAILAAAGIRTAWRFISGSPFIAHARNKLVTDFLTTVNPQPTDLFFIDDDIGWPPHKVLEFLQRPEQVVAGVYPKREDIENYPCTLEIHDGGFIQNDHLLSAILAPLGFCRIKRKLLEGMAQDCRRYNDLTVGKNQVFDLFETGFNPAWNEWRGEDYDFCRKVRERGEAIWVDSDINFTHRGTKLYMGNFKAFVDKHADEVAEIVKRETEKFEAEQAKAEVEEAA